MIVDIHERLKAARQPLCTYVGMYVCMNVCMYLCVGYVDTVLVCVCVEVIIYVIGSLRKKKAVFLLTSYKKDRLDLIDSLELFFFFFIFLFSRLFFFSSSEERRGQSRRKTIPSMPPP